MRRHRSPTRLNSARELVTDTVPSFSWAKPRVELVEREAHGFPNGRDRRGGARARHRTRTRHCKREHHPEHGPRAKQHQEA